MLTIGVWSSVFAADNLVDLLLTSSTHQKALEDLDSTSSESKVALVLPLLRSLNEQNVKVHEFKNTRADLAVDAIKHMGHEVIPQLGALIVSSDEKNNIGSYAALAMSEFQKAAIPSLTRIIVQTTDIHVFRQAAGALVGIQNPSDKELGIPALIRSFENKDWRIRVAAPQYFYRFGIGNRAIPYLTPKLKSADIGTVCAAIRAIGWLRKDGKEALPILLPFLNDKRSEERFNFSRRESISIDDEAASSDMGIANYSLIELSATIAILDIDPKNDMALVKAIELMDRKDYRVRRAIANSLFKVDRPEAIPVLMRHFNDPDQETGFIVGNYILNTHLLPKKERDKIFQSIKKVYFFH